MVRWDRITTVSNVEERDALARLVANGKHLTVVGSSWNAVELASHLASIAQQRGWSSSVSMIFPEAGPLAKQVSSEVKDTQNMQNSGKG